MPDSIPKRIQLFVKSCLVESQAMRPNDAWALLDEFTEVLESLFGPPKFHHLAMS